MSDSGGPRAVELTPHDESWRDAFEEVAAEVRDTLGAAVLAVHHIGSTAMPSVLWAKPVIDVIAEVASLPEVDRATSAMTLRGFEARGEYGIPGRRYFVRPAGHGRLKVHLHVYASEDREIARHVRFRDYLIAHPEDARAYAELKRDLARSHESDRPAYQAGKANFIARIDRAAAEWTSSGAAAEPGD